MRNGPRTNAVHNLPPNSPILVWREGNTGQAGHWNGPYDLLTVEGETCTVKLPSGPTPFRSTAVKPYLRQELTKIEPEIAPETEPGTHPNYQRPETEPGTDPNHRRPDIEPETEPDTEAESRPQDPDTDTTAPQPPKRGRGRP